MKERQIVNVPIQSYENRATVLLGRARDWLGLVLDRPMTDDPDERCEVRNLEYDIDRYLADIAQGRNPDA